MGIEEEFLEKIVLRLGSRSQEMLLELLESNELDTMYRAKQLLLKVGGKEIILKQEAVLDAPIEKLQDNELIKVYCFGTFEAFGKDDV